MFDVIFYSDNREKEPIADFISELRQKFHSNKTPQKEIEQARRNLADYIKRNGE